MCLKYLTTIKTETRLKWLRFQAIWVWLRWKVLRKNSIAPEMNGIEIKAKATCLLSLAVRLWFCNEPGAFRL